MRRFPIMHGDRSRSSIPWSLLEPHEAQAKRNHDQTLERLAQRGGLSPVEALAVIEGRPFRWVRDQDANAEVDAWRKLRALEEKEARS